MKAEAGGIPRMLGSSFLRHAAPLAADAAVAFVAMTGAFWLRFDQDVFLSMLVPIVLPAAALYGVCSVAAYAAFGTHRGVWRAVSFDSLRTVFVAALAGMLVYAVLQFMLTRFADIPRAVPIIAMFLNVSGLLASRSIVRMIWERQPGNFLKSRASRIRVLLAGTGPRAASFVREAAQDRDAPYHVVGLLSTDRTLVGRHIQNTVVLGHLDNLSGVIARLAQQAQKPSKIVVAEELSTEQLTAILDTANESGLTVGRVPRLFDLAPGSSETKISPISVADLLNRPEVRIADPDRMRRLIAGKRILVTGAGGSIGSELCRQIASMGPEMLTLLDSSEFGLYEIDREIGTQFPDLPRNAVICDVRDRARVQRRLQEARPHRVFHAAALKHVPLMEHQPCEAILTNLGGTINVVDTAAACGVQTVVLVSTDKAVNPTNVMGTTKRAAEIYAQALDLAQSLNKGMRIITVRFGNVLGSNGSVVPLFKNQIEAGGPVTVTHPDMRRFFMSIPEAVLLILEAMASGVEREEGLGRIFVLDMGEPVKIVDLARQMIRLSGKRPDVDIAIRVVGTRPGEKLYEEVAYGSEGIEPAHSPGLMIASAKVPSLAQVEAQCQRILQAASAENLPVALSSLTQLVPEARLTSQPAREAIAERA
jgi:O-antigen biosynthesis protein WbqV